jgi:hypothetical protein
LAHFFACSPSIKISSETPTYLPPCHAKDFVYVTITVADVTDSVIELSEKKLTFTGKGGNGKEYKLNLDFFANATKEGSVWNVLPSGIQMIVRGGVSVTV